MFERIRANKIKSALLVGLLALFMFAIGLVFGESVAPGGGQVGIAVALVIWLVLTLVSYYGGSGIMLALSHARPIEKRDAPQLFNIVEEMSIASGLPMPKVYIIEDSAPNAFATGRNPRTACVAVTRGLLDKMNRDELQGVIAHEMGHVLNRDILFMMMAGILLGVIVLLCDAYLRNIWRVGRHRSSSSSRGKGGAQAILLIIGLIMAILAPILARLLYLAISRRREYLADATSAALTRYPEGLASALEKIANAHEVLEVANRATSPMYIVNPIKPFESRYRAWESTHPPLGERIKILRSMAGAPDYLAYQNAWRQVCEKGPRSKLISPAEMSQSNAAFARPSPPPEPRP